jgi:Leucine-rich repeat (LRR) protein
MRMVDFPVSWATALGSLTALDLSQNGFATVPAALSQITTLAFLDLSFNPVLGLSEEDAEILAPLCNLIALGLIGIQTKLAFGVILGQRLPSLRVPFVSRTLSYLACRMGLD